MASVTVTLLDSGEFSIPSQSAGKHDYRVLYDRNVDDLTWSVISSVGGNKWTHVNSFGSLDEALNWCVSLVTGTFPTPAYGVVMPCGGFLSRPGHIRIENVMAAIGWVFVRYVTACSPLKLPKHAGRADAVSSFEATVDETTAILGDVYPCDEAEDGEMPDRLWIADVVIPVHAFVRSDSMADCFRELYEEEGVDVLDDFEHTTLVDSTPHAAQVVDLDVFRKARLDAVSGASAAKARRKS